MRTVTLPSITKATAPRLLVPSGSGEVVVTKISPTVLSTDLLSPQQFRVTLPTIGECQRERVAQSWGTHAVKYGGVGGLPFLGESRMKDFPVGRSHRHFKSGFTEYKTSVQPYRRTELTLSESRINDQRLPPPPHRLIWDKKAEAPWPQNDAYWSHSPVFEVFPIGTKRTTAANRPDLGPVARKALQDVRKKEGTSTYQEAHCDNIKDKLPPSKTQKNHVVPKEENQPLLKLASKRLSKIKSARRRKLKSAKAKAVAFKDGTVKDGTIVGVGPSWPPSTGQVIDKFLLKERSALDVLPEALNKRTLQPIVKSGRSGKLPKVPDRSEGGEVDTAIPPPATACTLPMLALTVKNLPKSLQEGEQARGGISELSPSQETRAKDNPTKETEKKVQFEGINVEEKVGKETQVKKADTVADNVEEQDESDEKEEEKEETEGDSDEKTTKEEEKSAQPRARSLPEGFFGKRRLLKLGNWSKSGMHQRFTASCPETVPDLRDGLTYPARKRHFFYGSHSCVFRG